MLNNDGEEVMGVWLKCGVCGGDFEVLPCYAEVRVLCGSDVCLREYVRRAMSRYRGTEAGKAYYREYNKRYRRPVVEKVCKCGKVFVTAYVRRVRCDECKVSRDNEVYKK